MSPSDLFNKQKEIQSIIEDISILDNPKFDPSKMPQLTDFIATT